MTRGWEDSSERWGRRRMRADELAVVYESKEAAL
jgi:hypothetical protein